MIEQFDKLSITHLDFCVKYLAEGITANEKLKEHSCQLLLKIDITAWKDQVEQKLLLAI